MKLDSAFLLNNSRILFIFIHNLRNLQPSLTKRKKNFACSSSNNSFPDASTNFSCLSAFQTLHFLLLNVCLCILHPRCMLVSSIRYLLRSIVAAQAETFLEHGYAAGLWEPISKAKHGCLEECFSVFGNECQSKHIGVTHLKFTRVCSAKGILKFFVMWIIGGRRSFQRYKNNCFSLYHL